MTRMKLHGIFAPLTTPFDSDGNVALGEVRNNVALYNKTKLAGYVPNGSTSESVLLLWEEVYKVWEAVRDAAAPGKILIAGTGAESTAETIEHTNRAARIGYAVALVRTPSFYKPSINDHMLAEHYLRVADAARIPVLVYSVPVFTHVTVEASLVARVAKHPNIIGMKDSSGDMNGIAAIIAAAPKEFQTLTGSASTLYEALELGAAGAILGLADVFPDLCAEIYEAASVGDRAKAQTLAQKLMPPAKTLLMDYGIGGLKYAQDRMGFYGGLPRLPLLGVSDAGKLEIDSMLANLISQPAHHL
ncbi:MAG TPA: dihydrodipicolinate synthase family protein [Candidatus Acidoferrales bacterium]